MVGGQTDLAGTHVARGANPLIGREIGWVESLGREALAVDTCGGRTEGSHTQPEPVATAVSRVTHAVNAALEPARVQSCSTSLPVATLPNVVTLKCMNCVKPISTALRTESQPNRETTRTPVRKVLRRLQLRC